MASSCGRLPRLLAHLELAPDLLMPWPVVHYPSVVCYPSIAFHIFDISSRAISWIELKLRWGWGGVGVGVGWGEGGCALWQHGNSELLNYSILISKMAILKFFKQHLLQNHKSD